MTYPAKVDDDNDDQRRRGDANQTEVATVTTAGESESDSEDDSDSDTDSDSDDDDLDDDIAAVTGETPGTFDDEAQEPEPEEEVEEIPNVPHRTIRTQPTRAAKQGVTYSALNVEQHPVHDDCDPRVVGKYIHAMNHSFIQTYSLKAGLRKFKDRGMAAALKEMKQQHKRACFVPINYDDLTKTERGKMMEMVSHMLEKRDKTVKFCNCVNGSVQRNWMGKEDTSSPLPPLNLYSSPQSSTPLSAAKSGQLTSPTPSSRLIAIRTHKATASSWSFATILSTSSVNLILMSTKTT